MSTTTSRNPTISYTKLKAKKKKEKQISSHIYVYIIDSKDSYVPKIHHPNCPYLQHEGNNTIPATMGNGMNK